MFQGQKLKRLLDARGWTERKAERELGKLGYRVTQSTLSELINGSIVNPQPRTVDKLSKAFKVDRTYWYIDDAYLPDEIPGLPPDLVKTLMSADFIPYAVILRDAIASGLKEPDLKMLIQVWSQTKAAATTTTNE
jgi:transcriptional regulator with XRE-family HTH domain